MEESFTNLSNVVLWLKNQNEVVEISEESRNLGLYTLCASDFASLLTLLNENQNSFCIVDIFLASQVREALKTHPSFKNLMQKMVFFYSESSEVLLGEFLSEDYLGVIKQKSSSIGINYSIQMKGIVKRFDRQKIQENKIQKLTEDLLQTKEKIPLLAQSQILYKEREKSLALVLKFGEMFREIKYGDFVSKLALIVGKWIEINNFTILEISADGRVLESPIISEDKYHHIPTINLSRAATNGIEFHCEQMAIQIANEHLGANTLAVKIYGQSNLPVKILFVHFSSSIPKQFPLDALEKILTAEYMFSYYSSKSEIQNNIIITPYEMAENIKKSTQAKSLLQIELPIQSLLLGSMTSFSVFNTFYYHKFFSDFTHKLFKVLRKENITFCLQSPFVVLMLLDEKENSQVITLVSQFVKDFPYWRYTNSADVIYKNLPQSKVKYLVPHEASLFTVDKSLDFIDKINRSPELPYEV